MLVAALAASAAPANEFRDRKHADIDDRRQFTDRAEESRWHLGGRRSGFWTARGGEARSISEEDTDRAVRRLEVVTGRDEVGPVSLSLNRRTADSAPHFRRISETESRIVGDSVTYHNQDAAWHPDGERIAFTYRTVTIPVSISGKLTLPTGLSWRISDPIPATNYSPAWSSKWPTPRLAHSYESMIGYEHRATAFRSGGN